MASWSPSSRSADDGLDVYDLMLAVRPEARRAGLPGAADCMITTTIAQVRQPEERLVAGPMLLDMDLPILNPKPPD